MEKEFKKRLEKILENLSDEKKHGTSFTIDPKNKDVIETTELPEFAEIIGKHKDKIAESIAGCILYTAYRTGETDTTKKVIKLIDSYDVNTLNSITFNIREAAENDNETLDRVIDLYNHPPIHELDKTYKGSSKSDIMYELYWLAEPIEDIGAVKDLVSSVAGKYKGHTLGSVIHAMSRIAYTTEELNQVNRVVEIAGKYKGKSVDTVMNIIIQASDYAMENLGEKENINFLENLLNSFC